MGALLDLGAGFHPDLTGRENAHISAVVGGLTSQEAKRRFDSIVEFAEIGAFIDNPLRTYSAGMQMRLGFAVAIHTTPDVLFVDEYLSVGDLAFQNKCLDRILELKNNGCAIVLISHNAEQVQELCDQAIWLEQGRLKAYGDPEVVAGRYAGKMEAISGQPKTRTYSQQVEIRQVEFGQSDDSLKINSGDPLSIDITYDAHQAFDRIIVGLSISDGDGQIYFNTHSGTADLAVAAPLGLGKVNLTIDRLDLPGGDYFVNVGLYAPDWSETHDYQWNKHPFSISWTPQEQSLLNPPKQWRIVSIKNPAIETAQTTP
jgi:lipopolysaccharide transport system ATP-binding protein